LIARTEFEAVFLLFFSKSRQLGQGSALYNKLSVGGELKAFGWQGAMMIFHITQRIEWEEAVRAGEYRAASLNDQGFIHCSTPEQVVRVANFLFAGQRGLVLLCIDVGELDSKVHFFGKNSDRPAGEIQEAIFIPAQSYTNQTSVECT
jgi:uncharacterized protein (DUF952 family)